MLRGSPVSNRNVLVQLHLAGVTAPESEETVGMPTTYFRKLPLQMNVVCKENRWWLFMLFPYLFCRSELITHVGWICSFGVWQRGRGDSGVPGLLPSWRTGSGEGVSGSWLCAAPHVRGWGFASRVSQSRLTSNSHTMVFGA